MLERKVTISAQNEPIELVLQRISAQAGCVFSYSPTAIDVKKRITQNFSNQSIREVLIRLFEDQVLVKEKGVYLILTPAPQEKKEIKVSGYVEDPSGNRLRNATVYDPITLRSSLTDEYGFFEFQVKNPTEPLQLIVRKEGYADTVSFQNGKKSYFRNIALKLDPDQLLAWTKDSTGQLKKFWKWNKNSPGAKNLVNVTDTLYRQVQISFLPFLGSNRNLSGSVINNYSFNVLGGYSAGTQKAELGGVFNINRGDVGSFQAAGVFNYTGGTVSGLQLGGVTNFNRGHSKGLLAAGVVNVGVGSVEGAQLAGVLNVSGTRLSGVQIAGVSNLTFGEVSGTQISGVFNAAGIVKGTQLALFNYADSISQGIPIGLFSFVRKGYHVVEFSTNEVLPMTISLRSGTRGFYSMIYAGLRPEPSDSVTWSFGYGIGSSPKIGKNLHLNLELSSEQLNKGNVAALNLISRAHVAVDWQVSPKVALFAGPTFNLRTYDLSFSMHPETFSLFQPRLQSDRELLGGSGWGRQSWWGLKAGIRFF